MLQLLCRHTIELFVSNNFTFPPRCASRGGRILLMLGMHIFRHVSFLDRLTRKQKKKVPVEKRWRNAQRTGHVRPSSKFALAFVLGVRKRAMFQRGRFKKGGGSMGRASMGNTSTHPHLGGPSAGSAPRTFGMLLTRSPLPQAAPGHRSNPVDVCD